MSTLSNFEKNINSISDINIISSLLKEYKDLALYDKNKYIKKLSILINRKYNITLNIDEEENFIIGLYFGLDRFNFINHKHFYIILSKIKSFNKFKLLNHLLNLRPFANENIINYLLLLEPKFKKLQILF